MVSLMKVKKVKDCCLTFIKKGDISIAFRFINVTSLYKKIIRCFSTAFLSMILCNIKLILQFCMLNEYS